jgi:hypothetical protein
LASVLTASTFAQGPGSCGFHLDIITNDTSTHAAVADLPGGPGAQLGGLAPGSIGNPFSAWATAGTQVKFRVEAPPTTVANFASTTPVGSGGLVSIFYSAPGPNILLPPPAGAIPACSIPVWVISVLPVAGSLIDGAGLLGPPPVIPPSIPGFPSAFEITGQLPVGLPPLNFQAAVMNPNGQLAVTNGVTLITGTSPWQAPVTLFPPTGCPWTPSDEGIGNVTMPPGFRFYDVPTGNGVVRPNGLVEFGPAAGTGCPFDATVNGFGCLPALPEVTPRVAVNIVDNDLAVTPAGSNVVGLTVEYAPPTGTCPSRTIVRWKHATPWYAVPGSEIYTDHATSVVEFWGANVPGGSPAAPSTIVVVRQDIRVGLDFSVHGMTGIGPGYAGQGYNGPPTACNYVDFWSTWGGWYFLTAPYEAAFLNFLTPGSLQLAHLATVFEPSPTPGQYRIEAY